MIHIDQKTAPEIASELAARIRTQRKSRKLTQAQMARKAGMSLSSYKRFEQTGQIALHSLINISIALGCEDDFDELFTRPYYASIEDAIAANR